MYIPWAIQAALDLRKTVMMCGSSHTKTCTLFLNTVFSKLVDKQPRQRGEPPGRSPRTQYWGAGNRGDTQSVAPLNRVRH